MECLNPKIRRSNFSKTHLGKYLHNHKKAKKTLLIHKLEAVVKIKQKFLKKIKNKKNIRK